MPAPKRRNEGVTNGDNEPQTKRRSARQAAQKVLELDSPVKDEPRKAVKGNKGIEKRKSAGGPSKSDLEAIGAPGAVSKTPALKSRSGATAKAKEPKPKQKKAVTATKEELDARNTRAASEDPDVTSLPDRNPDVERHDGEWYWLMKAEPESRLENGIDVKFSIDDLRQKSVPEPWDGIRAYPARNNLRAMNFGDKAFFYHSNCKEPSIVGIMEVVKEFSEDKGARRPGTAYYDPSSTKEKPKWGLVHVKFVKKFAVPITLKELRELGQSGKPLERMQMLKQSRLSVSKVSKDEWLHLCQIADQKAKEAGLKHGI